MSSNTQKGKLNVRISSGSVFLTRELPIEIRDAHHALVRRLNHFKTSSLRRVSTASALSLMMDPVTHE